MAAAATLTVLMLLLMTVSDGCLFVFRQGGKKNVLAGWCLGFVLLLFVCLFLFFFLSNVLALKKKCHRLGLGDFFCDHLD